MSPKTTTFLKEVISLEHNQERACSPRYSLNESVISDQNSRAADLGQFQRCWRFSEFGDGEGVEEPSSFVHHWGRGSCTFLAQIQGCRFGPIAVLLKFNIMGLRGGHARITSQCFNRRWGRDTSKGMWSVAFQFQVTLKNDIIITV